MNHTPTVLIVLLAAGQFALPSMAQSPTGKFAEPSKVGQLAETRAESNKVQLSDEPLARQPLFL